MEKKLPDTPAVILVDKELCIYLIGEELKSWKFFNTLRELGLDDSFYQTDLSELILNCIELDYQSQDVLDFYQDVMEKHSHEMKADLEDVKRRALLVYEELVGERKSAGGC